jgi:hypothetical protein
MRSFWVCASILFLASCDALDARINTSSPDAYKASIAAIEKNMSAAEKAEFEQALFSLAMGSLVSDSDNPFASLSALASATPEKVMASIGPKINGKTGKDIIRLSLDAQIERADTQIATLSKEVKDASAEFEAAKGLLGAIKVENAKFYWDTSNQFIDQPTIALKITNAGQIPLSRVYFHGLLETPGRSIPWVSDTFNYEIAGGLEPNESQSLALEPNMFSDWGKAPKDRKDLVLTVTLTNFEGADHKQLISLDATELAEKQKSL